MATVKVLLVEDDRPTRERLSGIISEADGVKLSGTAATLGDAKASLESQSVDCLVTDICLPDGSGLELIKWSKERFPSLPSIVISVLGDETTLLNAISYGAGGYLLKDADEARLRNAVHEVMNGGAPISAFMARFILKNLPQSKNGIDEKHLEGTSKESSPLTTQEARVLSKIARGYTYKETAEKLGLCEHTIPNYIKNIYRKLHVHSRGEAVYEALKRGYISKPS